MNNIKTTDLNAIKDKAKLLVYFDIKETKVPFIAQHPYIDYWHTSLKINDEYQIVDLHDQNMLMLWREKIKGLIDTSNINGIFCLISKSYRMSFLNLIKDKLDNHDLGSILSNIWQSLENTNNVQHVISDKQLISLFKRADKTTLMNEEELEEYNSLPNEITLYRGVTSYNNKNEKALSWTPIYDTAKWFANRFDTHTGEIWTITIPRDRVLCIFNGREQEVIVNLYGYNGKIIKNKLDN